MPLHLLVLRQSPDPSGASHLSPTARSKTALSSRELAEEAGAGAVRPRAHSDTRMVTLDFIMDGGGTGGELNNMLPLQRNSVPRQASDS
jgi:hypothetical protein